MDDRKLRAGMIGGGIGAFIGPVHRMAETEAKLPEDQRLDFVVIVTPNSSHFAIARAFLEHGFHVVCEKPVALTLEEARTL